MKTKEELQEACNAYFSKAHSSWWPIKEVVMVIIDKYHHQLEVREYIVEISEDNSEIFHENPVDGLRFTNWALSEILAIQIDHISLSGNTIKVTKKE